MTIARDTRWDVVEVGSRVRITIPWRTPVTTTGPNAWAEWIDHEAGIEGTVVSSTNAGFRGIEYAVLTDEGRAHGIGACHLEALNPEPTRYAVRVIHRHDSKDSTMWVMGVRPLGESAERTYVGYITAAGDDMLVCPDGTVADLDMPNDVDVNLVDAIEAAITAAA